MANRVYRIIILLGFAGMLSCSKDNTSTATVPPPVVPPSYALSYGDSVFFIQNQAADYIITPKQAAAGVYTGFPEGIEIDNKTGAINLSKSETGLRYRVSFKPADGTDTFSTMIVVSGINFLDGFYKQTTKDSILHPLYNANAGTPVPGINGSSAFDEGAVATARAVM